MKGRHRWTRRAALAAAAGLACLASVAQGDFQVETGTVTVELPPSAKGSYSMSLANFGKPVYGGTKRGQLIYQRSNQWGCTPFETKFDSTYTAEVLPVIALIDRGGPSGNSCSFLEKAYNAQNAGAAAVLIVDNVDEGLITMDAGSDDRSQHMVEAVTVPVALIQESAGDAFKALLNYRIPVILQLSWVDVEPHTAQKVEWEFWSNSNDECGYKCDRQRKFISDFADTAAYLERNGYTTFTPHYITLQCPAEYLDSDFCKSQCINRGRYCEQDPDGSLTAGFTGADVVEQNLRQLCVFQWGKANGKPWVWWQYVAENGRRCSMGAGKYSRDCLVTVERDQRIDTAAIDRCVGNPSSDAENDLLKAERAGLVSNGRRGDISIQPTLISNGVQFRGEIDNATVLSFLCAGFEKGDAPSLCLQGGSTDSDQCLENKFGAIACKARGIVDGMTRCVSTTAFPYWTCACPRGSVSVTGSDGLPKCSVMNQCLTQAAGIPECNCPQCVCRNMPDNQPPQCSTVPDECAANNGNCWQADIGGKRYTACKNEIDAKRKAALAGQDPSSVRGHSCACPAGFKGDGVTCTDVDECADSPGICGTGDMSVCVNTIGGHTCECKPGFYKEGSHCVRSPTPTGGNNNSNSGSSGTPGWAVFLAVFFSVGVTAVLGYLIYQWRLKQYMNTEIRSIMSQYMPLERPGGMGQDMGSYEPPSQA